MSALSIRSMNWTMGQMEIIAAQAEPAPQRVSESRWKQMEAEMWLANTRKPRMGRARRCQNCRMAFRAFHQSLELRQAGSMFSGVPDDAQFPSFVAADLSTAATQEGT